MKNFAITLSIIVLILILSVGIFYGTINSTYKNLAQLEENISLQYAQVEANLQRRVDLLPNYFETVKGQMEHDEALVAMIAEGRANVISAMKSGDMAQTNEAMANYDVAVDNYMNFVIENYPELSAGQAFQDLRDELAGTENRIAVSRQYYNEAVNTYNSARKNGLFATIVANLMGFKEAEYFESASGSETAPTFSFD